MLPYPLRPRLQQDPIWRSVSIPPLTYGGTRRLAGEMWHRRLIAEGMSKAGEAAVSDMERLAQAFIGLAELDEEESRASAAMIAGMTWAGRLARAERGVEASISRSMGEISSPQASRSRQIVFGLLAEVDDLLTQVRRGEVRLERHLSSAEAQKAGPVCEVRYVFTSRSGEPTVAMERIHYNDEARWPAPKGGAA